MTAAAIGVYAARPLESAAEILRAALTRSFTGAQVVLAGGRTPPALAVFPHAGRDAESLRAAIARGGKIFITGQPDPDLAPLLGLSAAQSLALPEKATLCERCRTDPWHESACRVRYAGHPLALCSPVRDRPFLRYDYEEWNNLGYGAIRKGGDFGVLGGIKADGAAVLAEMYLRDGDAEERLGPYLALLDLPKISLLWCARPVGPVDGPEWGIVEEFFSGWRAGDLPCLPCLLRAPAGSKCLATMRLDCDEAVASARDLFAFYRDAGIPFSLAVKTGQELRRADLALLREVAASGGSLLTHSHDHARNWGRNREEVAKDVRKSLDWFREKLPELPVPHLAVSPFHSNPIYAVEGLRKAGLKGFVGGIIHNDPAFLLGRAGQTPFVAEMLSISQQSMLHGDSYRNQGYSAAVHEQAFLLQYQSRGIFGYLDHPFSERYQYGWESSGQRNRAHQSLVGFMRGCPGVLFWSQEACFAFVERLSAARISLTPQGGVRAENIGDGAFRPACRLRGEDAAL